MPIFEYRCGQCGAKFEDLETVADRDKPRPCPVCGAASVVREVSVFAAKVARGASSPVCNTSRST